jgi:uncharacterized protein YbaP (TraB family)
MKNLGALVLGLVLFAAGPALAKPAVWVLRDADSTILLFGSVHMLPPNLDWTPAPLAEALAQADDLWFEVPLDEAASAEISAQAARQAVLPPGERLTAMLDPTSLARLKRLSRKLKIPVEALDGLQPWMAEVQLSVAFLEMRGGLTNEGVEQRVAALARPDVRVKAFETAPQQVAILAGDNRAAQLTSLKETLRELTKDPGAYDRMLKAWLTGDTKALDKEAVEPMRKATPTTYESLVVNRNKAWVTIIRERLAGSGRTVMVVGAGHLVGPDSVPGMLRAAGIPVEGP